MYSDKAFLKIFIEMGEALLLSGAEIFRVEDTLNRMGRACGAVDMNVFVITSSIVITMEFPDGGVLTRTKRIRSAGGNDFVRLGQPNDISREFCKQPFSAQELEMRIRKVCQTPSLKWQQLAGNVIAGVSFTIFYGGSLADGAGAAVAAV